jgi:hypothetical protein
MKKENIKEWIKFVLWFIFIVGGTIWISIDYAQNQEALRKLRKQQAIEERLFI